MSPTTYVYGEEVPVPPSSFLSSARPLARIQRRKRTSWTMEEAKVALCQLYENNSATFKTENQEAAIKTVISGVPEVIAVLKTGEGKSLLFFLPSQLPSARTTVVVLPLVVLKEEMVLRCQKFHIDPLFWHMNDVNSPIQCPLIFVPTKNFTVLGS